MYLAGGSVVLQDAGWQRCVVLEQTGFEDVVMWNPWSARAGRLKDFGNEEYKEMLCLEAANASLYTQGDSVQIPGGGEWSAGQRVCVRAIEG